MSKRVIGERLTIDPEATFRFFENRASHHNAAFVDTATMYQDANPELARKRDGMEKSRVLPLLDSSNKSVLDVGCGVGRWAVSVTGAARSYLGTDFAPSLLDIARTRVVCVPGKVEFQCVAADRLREADLAIKPPFDVVLISGVLIYLNDDQTERCLADCAALSASAAIIYVREPVATIGRLSLSNFFSEDLNDKYSAIYRTLQEYRDIFSRTLTAAGYALDVEDRMYPDELEVRTETEQRFWLFRRWRQTS